MKYWNISRIRLGNKHINNVFSKSKYRNSINFFNSFIN